jgi:hypothetical protein
MYYDPDKDQSERFGWKKVCDEQKATEEEQSLWTKITLLVTAKFVAITLLLEI